MFPNELPLSWPEMFALFVIFSENVFLLPTFPCFKPIMCQRQLLITFCALVKYGEERLQLSIWWMFSIFQEHSSFCSSLSLLKSCSNSIISSLSLLNVFVTIMRPSDDRSSWWPCPPSLMLSRVSLLTFSAPKSRCCCTLGFIVTLPRRQIVANYELWNASVSLRY